MLFEIENILFGIAIIAVAAVVITGLTRLGEKLSGNDGFDNSWLRACTNGSSSACNHYNGYTY